MFPLIFIKTLNCHFAIIIFYKEVMFFETVKFLHLFKCTKFSELHAIVGLVGLVSSCLPGYFGVQNFLFWYFVGIKSFLVVILWAQFFLLVANFVIQRFLAVGCMRKCDRKQKYMNTPQIAYSILNRFQQLSVLFMKKLFKKVR